MCLRKMPRLPPIIIILGATGTGKSKLAVQIARKVNGEIISADSMQVYHGLDITSNKVTQAERAGVPHHMLDVCKPTDRFSVLDFRNRTLRIINEITDRRRVPIIVGGTSYYIESILWNMLISPPSENISSLRMHPNRIREEEEEEKEIRLRSSIVTPETATITRWGLCDETHAAHKSGLDTARKAYNEAAACTVMAGKGNIDGGVYSSGSKSSGIGLSVNYLINEIERLISDFEKRISVVVAQLNITPLLYSRTFYPTVENAASCSRQQFSDDYFGVLDDDDEAAAVAANSEADMDIVRVETTIMNTFVRRCLERAITSLHVSWNTRRRQQCDDGSCVFVDVNSTMTAMAATGATAISTIVPNLPHFSEFSNTKVAFDIAKRAESKSETMGACTNSADNDDYSNDAAVSVWVEDSFYRFIDDTRQREDGLSACRDLLEVILERASEAAEMRVARLKLVKIVEDIDLEDVTTEYVYSQLRLLDLPTAKNLHPNNRRKIIRAVQVFMQTGKPYSRLIDEQHQADGAGAYNASLRFPNALLLWLRCDQDVLNERLCGRIEEMLRNGLIEELEQFHEHYNLKRLMANEQPDYKKGIFQSIGLKEFHSFLVLSDEEKRSPAGENEKRRAVCLLKQAHIQYAKIQNRFIANKLVRVPDSKSVPSVFELDCTDLKKWREYVESKALALVEMYLKNGAVDVRLFSPVARQSADLVRFEGGEYFCDVCQRMFVGRLQWQIHYSSRTHRKCLYASKVKELQKKMITLSRAPLIKVSDDDNSNGMAELLDGYR